MTKISACVVSYNEEDKIEDCLISLVPVADEIIVVDSGSSDRTIEIAKKYTDRIISQEFLGFGPQKNLAVETATHEWILSLDCDERLSPELQTEIAQAKLRLDDGGPTAFDMPQRTFYINQWIDHAWSGQRGVRFFDRRAGRFGGREPHAHVVLSSGEVGQFRGDLLHYTCDSVAQHVATINRYSDTAARQMFEDGRRSGRMTPALRGAAMFIKMYVIKRAFMDGFAGFVVSTLSATEAFVRYTKLWYLQTAATEAET